MPPRFGLAPALLLGTVGILAIAYTHAVLTRPEVPDWKRVEDHDSCLWLSNMVQRGILAVRRSPRRTACRARHPALHRPRPCVQLAPFLTPDNSSSLPDALYMYDTLSARPDIVVHVSGPLTPNWDADAGAAHNLERAGCRRILWRIGESAADLGNACLGSVVIEWATNVTGADICDIVSLSTTYPGVNARANITLVPEPYAMLSEESSYEALAGTLGEEWKMGLLAHVLPAANPEVFHPVTTLHRAVTYFPRVSTPASEYPLPPRGYQYSVYKQCPYLQPPNPAKDINVFNRSSAFRRFWTAYEAKSASHLARAGICIFEGWQDGVLDARMARAMLSGCIVAAAPPDVEYGTISHLILPLSKSDDALPASNIEAALSNLSNAELDKRVLRAFIFARRALVGPMRLSQIFSILDRWEQGARGYILPMEL